MDTKKQPLILICGPTGVGKSDLAVSLAKKIGGEIISADSVQVYKGLDIGSAKITVEEMQGIKHYLIDCLNPDEEFGVNIFQAMAKNAINEIYSHGNIPIIVGGTAFYIQALLYDIDFTEENNESHEYRDMLLASVTDEQTAISLWEELNNTDPEYAASVHYNNTKRVSRALEYYHNTGKLFSEYNKEQSLRESPYNYLYFALNDDRALLYERINRRVDIMIKNGLIDEVKKLISNGYSGKLNSMSSIGYKEICEYLDGITTLENAIESIKQNSRHYAKRQLTWLRRERDVIFVERQQFSDNESILEFLLHQIKNKNIF